VLCISVMSKLKIITSLGPASIDPATIKELAGISDRFRLNTSHMETRDLELWLLKLSDMGRPVVADLQGAKIRIGNYPSVEKIPNKEVILGFGNYSDDVNHIPVPCKDIFDVVKKGEIINLNDSKIIIQVINNDGKKIHAKILQNGPLSSNKGINRAEHPLPFSVLSDRDKTFIDIAMKFNFTEIAFSFILDGNEADVIKRYCPDKKLIAKIERPEAFKFLSNIDGKFDELWLCRGDLGAQAGLKDLGKLQSEFVNMFAKLKKKKYLAGQVLEHMTYFPLPTRSEVVHLYDIIKAGFDGIVLSDETAIGRNPAAVTKFLESFI
jgi:pyruvate kinase